MATRKEINSDQIQLAATALANTGLKRNAHLWALTNAEKRWHQLIEDSQHAAENGVMTPDKLDTVESHLGTITSVLDRLAFKNTLSDPTTEPDTAKSQLAQAMREFETKLQIEQAIKEWRAYVTQFPYRIFVEMLRPDKAQRKTFRDNITNMLIKTQADRRQAEHSQRLRAEIWHRQKQGHYMIFQTLTISDEKLQAFQNTPKAIGNYYATLQKHVKASITARIKREYRKKYKLTAKAKLTDTQKQELAEHIKLATDDCFSYFHVAEYGSENGRLHFHSLIFISELPAYTTAKWYDKFGNTHLPKRVNWRRDPNQGNPRRNRIEIQAMKEYWEYGTSHPIALRYSGSPFSTELNWLAPLKGSSSNEDANEILQDSKDTHTSNQHAERQRHPDTIAIYICKYLTKSIADMRTYKDEHKDDVKWQFDDNIRQNSNRQLGSNYRTRMTRGLGNRLPPMDYLCEEALLSLTRINGLTCPLPTVVQRMAKNELVRRIKSLPAETLRPYLTETENLLDQIRSQFTPDNKEIDLTKLLKPTLSAPDLHPDALEYIQRYKLTPEDFERRHKETYASK